MIVKGNPMVDDTSPPGDDDQATPSDEVDDDRVNTVEDLDAPTFTVTNPPGTVSVSTFIDGRVGHVALSDETTTMTEPDLADEIVVIAGLATQDARAAQYEYVLDGMREQGHDPAAIHDFLSRDLGLPSPEDAGETRAQVFTERYAGDHD